jgi:sec-independent protein translocase protein TatB
MINMPGGPEWIVIMLVALMVLGPKELPKVMRTIGNVMAEVRKVSAGFQNEMRSAMDSITMEEQTKTVVKPQSGTMTSVFQPPSEAPATGQSAGGGSEVVARNPKPPRSEVSSPGNGAPSGTVAGPAADAADRASG